MVCFGRQMSSYSIYFFIIQVNFFVLSPDSKTVFTEVFTPATFILWVFGGKKKQMLSKTGYIMNIPLQYSSCLEFQTGEAGCTCVNSVAGRWHWQKQRHQIIRADTKMQQSKSNTDLIVLNKIIFQLQKRL